MKIRKNEIKKHAEMHFLLDLIIIDHEEGNQSHDEKIIMFYIVLPLFKAYAAKRISAYEALILSYETIENNFKLK